jgi:hypothetical protein
MKLKIICYTDWISLCNEPQIGRGAGTRGKAQSFDIYAWQERRYSHNSLLANCLPIEY